jgi:pimeloyl-ACP methyl ester carboxylesterase
VDYRLAGDLAYTSVEASLTTSGGCDLSYVWTEVDGVADAPLVILAHGFMRGPEQMADLGQHLATWGLSSAAVDLCHSSTFDIDPEANALDMVELADHLTGSGPRAYLGHSNGGMAALIAASFDERAVTVVGLDPVEAFGSDSAEFGAEVSVPGAALLGEPGLCNSDNSGAAAYGEISSSRALRVTEADHCDFEFPTWALYVRLLGHQRALLRRRDPLRNPRAQHGLAGLAALRRGRRGGLVDGRRLLV